MKAYISAVLVAVFLSSVAFANGNGPTIKTLHAVGKGLAISASDPGDFRLLKIGIARVNVHVLDEDTEVTVGILKLDEQKYKLKNIDIGNGSITADVFDNNTDVGDLSIASVQKGDTTIWFGTLSISGKNFNVFILEAFRNIKPAELGANVADFCRANRGHRNCRERMEDFCEQNPTDARCKEIFLEFCKSNPDDVRCRERVREFCQERPRDSLCKKILGERNEKFCEQVADLAEKECERTANACERACKSEDDQCERNCEKTANACERACRGKDECEDRCEREEETCESGCPADDQCEANCERVEKECKEAAELREEECKRLEELSCSADSDCACGIGRNGNCFYGNKQFVDTTIQCPDFCSGIAGDLEIKCVDNKCVQRVRETTTTTLPASQTTTTLATTTTLEGITTTTTLATTTTAPAATTSTTTTTTTTTSTTTSTTITSTSTTTSSTTTTTISASACTDSDGGLDYGTHASVKIGTVTSYDYCFSSAVLRERYCEWGSVASKDYTCPDGCSSGVCISVLPSVCSDTDKGLVHETYGSVNNGTMVTDYDYCFSSTVLREGYCDGSSRTSKDYTCPNGCGNGVCVTTTTTTA